MIGWRAPLEPVLLEFDQKAKEVEIMHAQTCGAFREPWNALAAERHQQPLAYQWLEDARDLEFGHVQRGRDATSGAILINAREDAPGLGVEEQWVARWGIKHHDDVCVHAIREELKLVVPFMLVAQHFERGVLGADDNGCDTLWQGFIRVEVIVAVAPEREFTHRPQHLRSQRFV